MDRNTIMKSPNVSSVHPYSGKGNDLQPWNLIVETYSVNNQRMYELDSVMFVLLKPAIIFPCWMTGECK